MYHEGIGQRCQKGQCMEGDGPLPSMHLPFWQRQVAEELGEGATGLYCESSNTNYSHVGYDKNFC